MKFVKLHLIPELIKPFLGFNHEEFLGYLLKDFLDSIELNYEYT